MVSMIIHGTKLGIYYLYLYPVLLSQILLLTFHYLPLFFKEHDNFTLVLKPDTFTNDWTGENEGMRIGGLWKLKILLVRFSHLRLFKIFA